MGGQGGEGQLGPTGWKTQVRWDSCHERPYTEADMGHPSQAESGICGGHSLWGGRGRGRQEESEVSPPDLLGTRSGGHRLNQSWPRVEGRRQPDCPP